MIKVNNHMGILDKFKNKKKDEEEAPKASSLKAEKVSKEKAEKPVEKVKKDIAVKSDKQETIIDKEVSVGSFSGILLKSMVSEKNSALAQLNQYVFEVAPTANKIQIAQAIKAKYGVEPIRVNVSNISGKNVRYGRHFGKQKDIRKAVVFLPAGKSIDVYKGV